MKVTGLDGREYSWSLRDRMVGKIDEVVRSGLHLKVRAILKDLFPTEPVLEEVSLPGSGGLELDFYLPVRRTAVEANGVQHSRYTPFYHGDRRGWLKQQQRDSKKAEWCRINSIRLVPLEHDEDTETWTRKLLSGD